MMENVRVDRTLQFGLNVTVKLGGGFGRSDVVVIAKPARAVALLLGDHDSLHASTDPLGDSIVLPDLVDPSLVVGSDDVSTGRWVVDVAM